MKDEIKEILDKLKLLCYDDYCLEFSVDYIERKEEKLLLDLITNLQEENKRLNKIEQEHQKLNGELREENNRLNANITYLQKQLGIDYQSRIDKAIEYMDRRDLEWGSPEHEEMMRILKGEDKE